MQNSRIWRIMAGLALWLALVAATSSCSSEKPVKTTVAGGPATPTPRVVSFATAGPTPTASAVSLAPATAQPTLTPLGAAPISTPSPLPATSSPVAATPMPAGSTPAPAGSAPAPTRSSPTPVPPTPTAGPTPTPTATLPPRPENENPLTGLTVSDPALLRRRPLQARVGNDPGARPQVGLSAADMVYEEITEWWVTRFTAIYLSNAPDAIGPIRSARLINTQLTGQYNAALINSGGSDPVRWELSQLPIVNLDEYFHPQPYFYRPGQGWQTRLAVNAAAARKLMASKGMEAAVPLRGFTFSDAPVGGSPAISITIPYPKATSPSQWRYDAASGRYLHWINGQPLVDLTNTLQISAANVIIYYAEHQPTDIVEDSNGATSIRIIVNGEGRAQVIRDGKVIEGRWRTGGEQTPDFLLPDGQLIPLKRGNSWVEVVPPDYKVVIQ
jgi:hypothetical protein